MVIFILGVTCNDGGIPSSIRYRCAQKGVRFAEQQGGDGDDIFLQRLISHGLISKEMASELKMDKGLRVARGSTSI